MTSDQNAINRRGFFRGAAALTLGGLSAGKLQAQTADADPRTDYVASLLHAQTQQAKRWGGNDPADFVRPRRGAEHNVVIVGGGQSGTAIAYGLRRNGIGRVSIIEQADTGQAGIWRKIARMHQLRTPKSMRGPEGDNPMLSVRGWYETLHGAAAWDALDRIPRLAWAEYLDWLRAVTGTEIRYRTRLLEIEPQGDMLRLHLETEGVRREETTRKLVLANGYAGAGGANLPGFLEALPEAFWSHTSQEINFEPMANKVIAIIGAGSSAFDAAAVALEAGAAEVHMLNRRPYVDYPGGSRIDGANERGHANVLGMTYELPDAIRWKNFVARDRRVASVPTDSIERAVTHQNFHLHLNSSVSDVRMNGNQIVGNVGGEPMLFDHVIAGTGYRIDLSAQSELAGIHDSIALWRDRYDPERGWSNDAAAVHPYLGAGMEFLPRSRRGGEYLRNIHCFNLSGALSFGIPVGDIPSTADQPRLVAAIARDLYIESIEPDMHSRFIEAPVIPADPAPWQSAIRDSQA